jgi:hypothetical protein
MNDARQQMLERIGEDESLTGDLAGTAAEQLRQWANDTALAIAQRADLDDESVQLQIKAVRTAARTASTHDGDIAVAQRELAALIDVATAPTVVVPAAEPSQPAPPQATPDISHTLATIPVPITDPTPQPTFLRIRGWLRGIWARVPKEE